MMFSSQTVIAKVLVAETQAVAAGQQPGGNSRRADGSAQHIHSSSKAQNSKSTSADRLATESKQQQQGADARGAPVKARLSPTGIPSHSEVCTRCVENSCWLCASNSVLLSMTPQQPQVRQIPRSFGKNDCLTEKLTNKRANSQMACHGANSDRRCGRSFRQVCITADAH